jgi:hypothetical protein
MQVASPLIHVEARGCERRQVLAPIAAGAVERDHRGAQIPGDAGDIANLVYRAHEITKEHVAAHANRGCVVCFAAGSAAGNASGLLNFQTGSVRLRPFAAPSRFETRRQPGILPRTATEPFP